ncbi:sensor histidine kinase [Clostridium sp. AF19-22AC]|jgi:signal transduction histidine kinase|uniref:sensor histidine kinase n=1 Tax=Clostridia TaxID=186801 RepID=UPI000E4FB17D|nr:MULTISPECIES: HAMP domain-containing sensor histidine kinase [Clostridia]RHR21173.1 sensor histidine kinase [Clostridium sp. AF19-22AC]
MKNWYKKPVTKGILLLLAHITAVFAVLSMVIILSFSGSLGSENFLKTSGRPYEESSSFKNMVYDATWEVMEGIAMKNNFESDGKYNPNKLVDIVDLAKNGRITGEGENGLVYELEDLVNWSNEYIDDGSDYDDANVVVCEKPDGTYHYYYMSEFKSLLEDGKLKIELENSTQDQFLSELERGNYTSGYYDTIDIKNENGDTEYTDCWTFNNALKEKYTPVGAANILEAVNNTPELNGKLSRVYGYLQNILNSLSYQVDRYLYSGDTWEEGNTNFTYMFVDENEKKVYTNNSKFKNYDDVKDYLETMKSGTDHKYLIVKPKLAEFESNMDISANEWRSMVKSYNYSKKADCIFAASIDTNFPIQDAFYTDAQDYNTYAPYMKLASVGSILCSILFFVILIWMTLIAGRCGEDGEVRLNAFDKWPTEIGAGAVIVLWIVPAMLIGSSMGGFYASTVHETTSDIYATGVITKSYQTYGDYLGASDLILAGILAAFTTFWFLFGFLSLVRRIKAKTLWSNSLLRRVCRFLKEMWRNRSVTFKAVLLLAVFILLHWFAMAMNDGGWFFMMMLASEAVALYFVVKSAIAKSQIKKGIKEIASGNVDYQIPLDRLRGENLDIAERVNDIGNGLQRAVEEGMKSERLKTDLITNVSHDIKTPLTSIINYVDLLKRENFNDPKIQGYLDILETKAQRLKTLTEDVVEASKVSSGNITLELMDVNLVEMINQTEGEFAEKFEAKNLQVVQNLPDGPAMIHVDGRRMWRVLENIYNNAAKYAMPGTRVYADLWVDEEHVRFSLKNISEQPLNISADELTERFIRGDISRSTEGSGLGLSIAKSLTQMQGGEFRLYLDGDLFKATIEFPRVR